VHLNYTMCLFIPRGPRRLSTSSVNETYKKKVSKGDSVVQNKQSVNETTGRGLCDVQVRSC
jgi:hypothetical protein